MTSAARLLATLLATLRAEVAYWQHPSTRRCWPHLELIGLEVTSTDAARLAELGVTEVDGVPIIAAPWMLESGRVVWRLRDKRVAAKPSGIGEGDGQLQP